MRRRVSCPTMIGRSEELGQLLSALARADAAMPAAVMVSGEAGIGKTRLLAELVAAAPDGVRVLRGGCVPLTDGLLPYAPIVELLQTLCDDLGREAVLDLAGPDRGILLALLPGGAESASVRADQGAQPIDATARPATGPGEADQHRLFAALSRLLRRLATTTTVLTVLEDLHWADPSTLALLSYLVHGLRQGGGRLLLVGSYRSDELPGRHPLRSLLAELDRAGVGRIELGRLGPAETAAQIAGVLNGPADPVLSERMHARCDGNPFLLEEVLAAGPDTDPLPRDTRDILLRRVRRLPADGQRLLRAVAVAGRRAEHDLLARVARLGDDEMLDHLRTAVDEQILTVVEDGYAFRHALVAEAMLAETLPGERVQLHRAYAVALAAQWGEGRSEVDASPARAAAAAEMAHHWCRAGEPVRALAACIDAGLAAERLFAQPEARQHFDRAIDLWQRAPQASASAPLDLVELCRHGAEAAFLAGDTDHAIALTRRALTEVDAGSDALRAGLLHERLGRYLWANGAAESESIGAYERALELIPDAPTAGRARALTGLASTLTYADRPDPSAWSTEALTVARAAGARGEEGRALQSLGYCRAMAGDVEGGLDDCRQALDIATELDQSDELYRAYVNLTGVLRMAGRVVEAATTALEGVEVARRRGADRTYGNLLLGDAVEALILLGRWDEADALLPDEPDVVAHGAPVIATNLWLSAANLHTWRGRFDRSQVFLDACMATYADRGHGHVRSMLHGNLSELCLWQGRFDEASQWVRRELDLLGATEFTSLLARIVVQGLRAEAGLSRPSDLGRLTDLLEDMTRRPDPPPDAVACIVMASAELARVRGESDPDLWAEMAVHMSKLDLAWPVSYARWRQAEVLLAGRPEPARRRAGAAALAEAYAIASRLGADPLRQEIAALARRARLLTLVAPAQRRGSDGVARPDLTTRERDVLQLMCTGATNRRIARQLFISEKTVSIHVSRILAKLDATNRGEAAAIAHRTGIIAPLA